MLIVEILLSLAAAVLLFALITPPISDIVVERIRKEPDGDDTINKIP